MLLACRWHLSRTFTARQLHTKSSFALGLKEEASLNPYHVPEGYLLPGILKQEFRDRRKKLLDALPDNSSLIVHAAQTQYMTHDIPYEFRQNSNFLYLTGIEEPEGIAVFRKTAQENSYTLFVRPRNAHSEQWDGDMVGIDGAIDKYEADKAFALPEMGRELGKMLHGLERVFVLGGRYSPDFLEATKPFHKLFYSGDFVVEQLRLFKSSYELERMKFASKIGCNAFKNMMSVARPGMTEIALASEFESSCKREGALWTSFPCVVAGGSNAAVVHYLTKRQLLKKEELVLVDAGCEVAGGYVSDITRTWPVDGKFTAAQRTLYELTLDVQKKCLEHLQSKLSAKEPLTLDELHDFSVQILMDGMRSLGILKLGPYAKQHDAIREFMKYNPTHIGHYLGMDVHDTSQISRAVPLTEGMVITVEPGIYIPRSDTSVPKEFQGIGIRIEDDVIIKADGIDVMTKSLPKEVYEIEK